jgi:hypothetical protein
MKLFNLCRPRRTRAGIATEVIEHEGVGLGLHAESPEAAVTKARRLMPWLHTNLIAIPTEN